MESKCETDSDGNKRYYNSRGRLHREDDLPAIEYPNGDKHWYINGDTHRETGPSRIYKNGDMYWHLNGIKYETPEDMPLSLFIAYCKYTLYGCSNDSRDT